MRYFILAGEQSGDLHGGNLVRALKARDGQAEIACWGGDEMGAAGAVVLKHYRDLAFMGFIEVILNLPTILRNFRRVKRQIKAFEPDVLILIDYPGFNLRMAKWASGQGIPVHYYISPQLWAWKEGRVSSVRKYVDKMYVILPFEQAFYARHKIDVKYVGHPLLEAIACHQPNFSDMPNRGKPIAILAGSRTQEVKHMLPIMLEVAATFPNHDFVVAAAPYVSRSLYKEHIERVGASNVHVLQGRTYDILSTAKAAMTTSGTATLETALFGVPQVVCYKGNALSFRIARRLVKVPFISLVNLIAQKPVVEELIQEMLQTTRLARSLKRVLEDPARTAIQKAYLEIRDQLDAGGASGQVAESIIASLNSKHGNL